MRNNLRLLTINAPIALAAAALLLLAAQAHAQYELCVAEAKESPATVSNGHLGCTTLPDYTIGGAGSCCPTCCCGPRGGGLLSLLFGRGSAAAPGCCDAGCGLGSARLGCLSGCRGGPGAGYAGDAPLPTYCGMPAPPYPAPHPTPQNVGYTYITYPPVMPHHSLPHYRGIYSFRHGPGLSRTNVYWRPTTVRNAVARVHHIFELPR